MDFNQIIMHLQCHWADAWSQYTELEADKKRNEELHPSSFPYCGLRNLHDLVKGGMEADTFDMSATMEYYCGVGTVAHLIFQKQVRLLTGQEGVFVGDWTCPTCKFENKFVPYTKCKKCKSKAIQGEVSRLSGDEISVTLGSRTTGHTDDVYRIAGKYYVVDYKTSSVRAVQARNKWGRGLPYKHNVNQIESYIPLLETKYGIEISGWILLYAARDKPDREFAIVGAEIDDEKRARLHKMIRTSDKLFDIIRTRVAAPLNAGEVILKSDPGRIEKMVNHICERKLCPTLEHYKEEVADPFNPCPMAESGMCHGPSNSDSTYLIRTIKKYNREIEKGNEDD